MINERRTSHGRRVVDFLCESKSHTWKAILGIAILVVLLIFTGMQIQAWRESAERSALIAAGQETLATCERRIISVRDYFGNQAAERAEVVEEVKRLADETLRIQKETLSLIQRRAPVTDRIARKVEQIDAKATTAAVAATDAKVEAARAATALESSTPVTPKAAGEINDAVRAINRSHK
ncbi:hypothetical protein [Noviherbaspirillum suwonense]|jgi:hypothetical protein|uniref:Uncharacterized protein n=1 Tax=Noviherbaspirillum suwonense TaxID=1224511 RepID=A0ABY1QIM3_9BURK|nr:hypothetical protein [Noviherbaspirillum suwonense]SMP72028.1 hypothetical protein SAMN06295970_117114 [Noviherbaspirillum suwonense]